MPGPAFINSSDIAVLKRRLKEAERVGIVTHTRPDGDAIGSSTALLRYVAARCPSCRDCRILLDTPLPSSISFVTEGDDPRSLMVYGEDPRGVGDFAASCDLLIWLDLAVKRRCGAMAAVLEPLDTPSVLIDHHIPVSPESFGLVFSSTGVSSTCELLCSVLLALEGADGDLPEGCLAPLLTGITTDTNNFANSVFPSTLATVSLLLEKGVDRDAILARLYNEYPERRFRLLGQLLDRGLTITERGVAIMVVDDATAAEFGIEEGDTEGFVNVPLGIDRVKVSIFLRQAEGEYRVSIRSKRGYSANGLAVKYFHGGGHENASGGKIPFDAQAPSAREAADMVAGYTDEFFCNA